MLCLLLLGCASDPSVEHPEDVRKLVAETPPDRLDELRGLPTVEMATLSGINAPYRIGIGDLLSITGDTENLTDERGNPALRVTQVKVKPDGRVYMPVLGGLEADGKTVVELQKLIEKEIVDRDLRTGTAFVSVDVIGFGSQRFYVVGQVGAPGAFPVDGKTRILDAVLNAGGVNQIGDLERSYMIRGGQLIPVDFEDVVRFADLSQNIQLRDQDVIYIPSAKDRHVYVFGKVANQGVFDMGRKSMTLVELLAQAGGLTSPEADASDITIFRGSLHDPRCFRISECEIMALGTNIGMQPGDRVLVGPSEWATARQALDLIDPFLRSTLNTVLIPFTIKNLIENE